MDDLNIVIARNLKKIRDERKLSLDKLADITGVSKTMLGQIERGESSPTVNTLWKIANGLKISFTTLVDNPQPDTVVISKETVTPLIENNGRYRVYPFFPYESGRRFEVYSIEIEKGGYLSADAHGDGTQEFVTVYDGELTIRVDNDEYTIKAGSSIRFRADRPHAYHNSGSGDTITRASMVIHYPDRS